MLYLFFIISGVFVSLFAFLALSCDLLALRVLRSLRKALMLPWLVLYAILVALVMAVVLTGTLFYPRFLFKRSFLKSRLASIFWVDILTGFFWGGGCNFGHALSKLRAGNPKIAHHLNLSPSLNFQ